jgi:hypothetical protein
VLGDLPDLADQGEDEVLGVVVAAPVAVVDEGVDRRGEFSDGPAHSPAPPRRPR